MFSDPRRSVLKTLVMTTGEFDFDTIYLNDDDSRELAYPIEFTILWVVFVIMMPILFSNLLVSAIYTSSYCMVNATMHIYVCITGWSCSRRHTRGIEQGRTNQVQAQSQLLCMQCI